MTREVGRTPADHRSGGAARGDRRRAAGDPAGQPPQPLRSPTSPRPPNASAPATRARRHKRYGVPELDRVADVLDSSAERIARMLTAERRLAADASHQLRTPLTALSMRLEEITLTDELETVKDEAAIALSQVERLTDVVDRLLTNSRDHAQRLRRHLRAGRHHPAADRGVAPRLPQRGDGRSSVPANGIRRPWAPRARWRRCWPHRSRTH
ncbi:hypothetical protein LV779_05175 [Streptomyces thinghirensis]|nr:hypothetical protein [Streptomyces thinghirensis]